MKRLIMSIAVALLATSCTETYSQELIDGEYYGPWGGIILIRNGKVNECKFFGKPPYSCKGISVIQQVSKDAILVRDTQQQARESVSPEFRDHPEFMNAYNHTLQLHYCRGNRNYIDPEVCTHRGWLVNNGYR